MIKQLQSRIIKLEETLQTREKDYLKKKQNYEKIIEEIQEQNQKLKNLISELNQSIDYKASGLKKSAVTPFKWKQPSDCELREAAQQCSLNQHSQLLKENNYLKQEIVTISLTYQKQIQQLTKYFEKIQSSSRLSQSYARDHANNRQIQGKITVLMSAYQSLLKNYDSQKQKFTDKIEELGKYLELLNEKNRKLQEQKLILQKKFINSQQRLKLFQKNLGS